MRTACSWLITWQIYRSTQRHNHRNFKGPGQRPRITGTSLTLASLFKWVMRYPQHSGVSRRTCTTSPGSRSRETRRQAMIRMTFPSRQRAPRDRRRWHPQCSRDLANVCKRCVAPLHPQFTALRIASQPETHHTRGSLPVHRVTSSVERQGRAVLASYHFQRPCPGPRAVQRDDRHGTKHCPPAPS